MHHRRACADSDCVDVELVAHRVGTLLGLQLRAAPPTTIELVGRVDDATRDRLADWLTRDDPSS